MRGSCGCLEGDLSDLVAEENLNLTCVRTSFFTLKTCALYFFFDVRSRMFDRGASDRVISLP